MDEEDAIDKVLIAWLLCLIGAGVLIALLVGLNGCTPAQRSTAIDTGSQTTITALKIAACVQGALAEEQLELLRQRREREAEAEIEADRLRSEMRVPSSISKEVDSALRDAGTM